MFRFLSFRQGSCAGGVQEADPGVREERHGFPAVRGECVEWRQIPGSDSNSCFVTSPDPCTLLKCVTSLQYFEHIEEMEWAIEVCKETGKATVATMCIGPEGDLHGVSAGDCAVKMARAGAWFQAFVHRLVQFCKSKDRHELCLKTFLFGCSASVLQFDVLQALMWSESTATLTRLCVWTACAR